MKKETFKKLLAGVFIVPLALGLSACKSENKLTISSQGEVTLEAVIEDDTGLLKQAGVTCDQLESQMSTEALGITGSDQGTYKVTDNSTADKISCTITATTPNAIDGRTLIEKDDRFILSLDSGGAVADEDLSMVENFGALEFSVEIVMPGKIIEATEGGEINGNSVKYTNIKVIAQGVKIESEKSGGTITGGVTDSHLLTIALGAIAILGIIGLVIAAVMRKKKAQAKVAAYPSGNAFVSQVPGTQAYGASATPDAMGGGAGFGAAPMTAPTAGPASTAGPAPAPVPPAAPIPSEVPSPIAQPVPTPDPAPQPSATPQVAPQATDSATSEGEEKPQA